MDNFEKIIAGILIFIITSILAYLFRMRQLYVATPKLFKHSSISNNGSLCEIVAFNRGNQVEADIQIDLDPDLKYELLATSSNNISLNSPTIYIERLHKDCEASMMLLVENGLFGSSNIKSISSKDTKGATYNNVSSIPPNYAKSFLFIIFAIGILPGFIYGQKLYDKLNNMYVELQLESTYSQGWNNLSNYYSSDLRTSYSNQEFPVKFIKKKDKEKAEFEIYNKTASTLKVISTNNDEHLTLEKHLSRSSVEIKPMSKGTLISIIPDPDSTSNISYFQFYFFSGTETAHGMIYELNTSKKENLTSSLSVTNNP